MQEIEPSFQWENEYNAAHDKNPRFMAAPIPKPNTNMTFMAITSIHFGMK